MHTWPAPLNSEISCAVPTLRNLKKFKLYVVMQYGQKAMDRLFWEIQALMVRTLRAVDRLIINDKQSFEVCFQYRNIFRVKGCVIFLPLRVPRPTNARDG